MFRCRDVTHRPMGVVCYWDPGHKGIFRTVNGDLRTDETLTVSARYGVQELIDDVALAETWQALKKLPVRDVGQVAAALGKPWHITLVAVAAPDGESAGNRWFFGNFSQKEAKGRHKDFYVRYLPLSPDQSLQFYEALPDRVTVSTSASKVNEWIRVLPKSTVSWQTAQSL